MLPGHPPDTVAVSGTGCPKTDGFTADVTIVVDAAAVTSWTSGPPLLGTSVPAYTTVMMWVPAVSPTLILAELWLVGTTCSPRNVSKSGVMTWGPPGVDAPSKNSDAALRREEAREQGPEERLAGELVTVPQAAEGFWDEESVVTVGEPIA